MNLSNPYSSIQQNILTKKKQEFRLQIRRQKINQMMKIKRKIFFTEHLKQKSNIQNQLQQISQQKCLRDIFLSIKNNQNLRDNIFVLVNLLATENPFQRLFAQTRFPSKQQINQFCNQIVNLIFYQTLPSFNSQQKQLRIYCLTALSNLFADQLCPNSNFVKIVTQAIQRYYGGIQLWELDKQLTQVYYMIGNLMNKSIIGAGILQIQILLRWCQQGIPQLDSTCLGFIIRGLQVFFKTVDQYYKTNSSHNKSYFIQHFYISRQNIIENLVKRLISSSSNFQGNVTLQPITIQKIITFLQLNKQYMFKCFYQWRNQSAQNANKIIYFLKRLILLINQQLLKRSILKKVCDFFIDIITLYKIQQKFITNNNQKQHHQQIQFLNAQIIYLHQKLFINCFDQLLKTFCFLEVQIKLIILKIIKKILSHSKQSLKLQTKIDYYQTFKFLIQQKKLDLIIIQFIDLSNKENYFQIFKEILEIYQIIIRAGKGQLGLNIKQKFQMVLENNNKLSEKIENLILETIKLHQQFINQLKNHIQI